MTQRYAKRFGPDTKVGQVCDGIRRSALKHGPGVKLPTSRELCAEYEISQVTLNEALNTLESQNVIVRKDRSGIFVSPKLHCKNIRVLINASLVNGSTASPFWGLLWGEIVKEWQRRSAFKNEDIHFQLVACHTDMQELPPDVEQVVENGPLDGLISIGMPQVIWAVPKTMPMVSFAGAGHWHVQPNDEPIVAEAAVRLAALGCGKIGLWMPVGEMPPDPETGPLESSSATAFKESLAEMGIPYYPELHFTGVETAAESQGRRPTNGGIDSYQDQGYQAAMRAFGDSGFPQADGLVITDDMMTFGALAAFRHLGIRPGVDIKIASHSNLGLPLLYRWEKEIIMWRLDPGKIVRTIFVQLDRLMAGEDVEQFAHVRSSFVE
jgi:DNA-binding LacI/PurR family transcriptional regulator